MSDSDEGNYVIFGTSLEPLDEENLPRKKPVILQDQYAVDEYGRRRFHGAFTGGFSAGYFNSVGTRDGWRPQQFKSSRSSKAGGITQRPEDFMDEEDTSEFGIAPTRLQTTEDYTDVKKKGTKRAREINDGPIPGIPVLQILLRPVRDRIGARLLKKMGWKPGQGVGPRVTKKEKRKMKVQNEKIKFYGCYMPSQRENEESSETDMSDDEYSEITFAPDDYEPLRANPKDNYFGLGYSGLDRQPVLSSHINLFEPQSLTLDDKNRKFTIKGQAFGVGAFEVEDEDIYGREDMSRYDFVLGPEKRTKSRWGEGEASESSGCLEGFVPAKNQIRRRKIFEPPELPKDFKPIHVVRKSRFFPPIEAPARNTLRNERKSYGGQNLNSEIRAAIIGEPSVSNIQKSESSVDKDSKNPSVASNIIVRTLNLHGKDQVIEKRKLEEERKISVASNSWMDKLYTASFVKGGIVGSDQNVEGSLQNLDEYKEKTCENKSNLEIDEQASGTSNQTSESDNLLSGTTSNLAKPFLIDPDKQRRFEQYLVFLKNGETQKLASIQPLSMTEWDRNHESTEFEQAARLFSASLHFTENKFVSSGSLKSSSIFSEPKGVADQMKQAAKMKMFGKLTREKTIWQPSSLLCKRFNVAEPRVGYAVETAKKKFSVFDSMDFCSGVSQFQKGSNLEETEIYEPRKESYRIEKENLNKEKMTEKEKNFEISYEKVFGKGVEKFVGNELSQITTSQESEDGTIFNTEVNEKGKLEEKKDLFKAIFLSSSEDSDSELEENIDSEVVKSVLIGKTPAEINVQRNMSPPRGIFAKLDLDSLRAPAGPSSDKDKKCDALGLKAESEAIARVEPEVICEEVLPPDVYGPLPPVFKVPSTKDTTNEEALQMPKPVFKSIVVKKFDGGENEIKGEWVERTKVKKSKKGKKKHKNKVHKHKKKSKKEKR